MELRTPFVSVVVPVLRDVESLAGCLERLDAQDYPRHRFEVIIVDNGPSPSIHRLCQGHSVLYVVEQRPGSYAARNSGLIRAKGDVIAFTDADCMPESDWLSRGVAAIQSHADCGAVAGAVRVSASGDSTPSAVELYEIVHGFPQDRYVTRDAFGVTANLFIPRSVLGNVGNFRADLKSGGDREWGQRAARAGYSIVFAPDVRVGHRARGTWRELFRKFVRVQKGTMVLHIQSNPEVPPWRTFSQQRFVPPIRGLWRARADPRLSPWTTLLRYGFGVTVARYLRLLAWVVAVASLRSSADRRAASASQR